MKEFKNDTWILQLYRPQIIIAYKAIYFKMDGRLTFKWSPKNAGFGIELFGFGFGLVYAPRESSTTKPKESV